MMRSAARASVLIISLAASGCVHTPPKLSDNDAAARAATNEGAGLKPKEGLTFRPHSFSDGVNAEPTYSDTGYEASDGETVTSKWYGFKRREGASEFYSKELARARAVLETGTQPGLQDDSVVQRAVVEFGAKGAPPEAAVLELGAGYVNEIVGPTVGHVLAFERWKLAEGRQGLN